MRRVELERRALYPRIPPVVDLEVEGTWVPTWTLVPLTVTVGLGYAEVELEKKVMCLLPTSSG